MEENVPGDVNPDNTTTDNGLNDTNVTPQSNWLDNLSDDFRKIAEAKAWKTENDVIKSYSELEKHASTKISKPKDGDTEGWNKLYAQLGRPENASGYDVKDVEQVDEPYLDSFKSMAFEAGLNNETANKLYQNYTKLRADQIRDRVDSFNKQAEIDQEKLKQEWGDEYQNKCLTMQRGFRELFVPIYGDDVLKKLEALGGTEKFMRFGQKIGALIAEDNATIAGQQAKSEEEDPEEFYNKMFQGK